MRRKNLTYIVLILLVTFITAGNVSAADRKDTDMPPEWDSAVSSLLLAAGMYGLDVQAEQGTDISTSQSKNLLKGIAGLNQLNSRNITFSYSGSSGRLGFSAGYIYTSMQEDQAYGGILLGLDPANWDPFKTDNPWYLALNLNKSFQVGENIAMGFGSKAMLMQIPYEGQDGQMVSMLLNLPLSYKNYFTITPELQWTRTLPDTNTLNNNGNSYNPTPTEGKDVFYGGMSISFSY